MDQEIPDLRNAFPGRSEVTSDNATLDDVVLAIAEYSKAISRFEATGESKFGLMAVRRGHDLIKTVEDLNRRIQGIRRSINGSDDI